MAGSLGASGAGISAVVEQFEQKRARERTNKSAGALRGTGTVDDAISLSSGSAKMARSLGASGASVSAVV